MKKLVFFLLVVLIILPLVFFVYASQPAGADQSKKAFTVNPGETVASVATRLEKNGLIKNRHLFRLYSRYLKLDTQLRAGNFYLQSSQKIPEIIDTLAHGGSTDYWFTIIPGQRLEEFTPSPEFTQLAFTSEGKLFPDSYLLPTYFTPQEILDLISKNFTKKLAQASTDSTSTLSADETLILASLLEREGRSLAEKKIIAGVILNRLDKNMLLQIDASVQYAKDSLTDPEKYWQPISKANLQLDSPFNTYKYLGLPPRPICNPGLDSLMAAYHPEHTDYLYYIHDKTGQIYYATTLDEHNTNVQKYLR